MLAQSVAKIVDELFIDGFLVLFGLKVSQRECKTSILFYMMLNAPGIVQSIGQYSVRYTIGCHNGVSIDK